MINEAAAAANIPQPDRQPPAPPAPASPPPLGLIKKLAAVMGAVGRIQKRGRNDHFGYSYALEGDIVDAVRGELSMRHVLVVPQIESTQWSEVPRRNGGTEKLCTLKMHFDFTDGETGEVLTVPMIGQGVDGTDKAIPKALTMALKYCLTKTLLIATCDDPENEPASAGGGCAAKRSRRAGSQHPGRVDDAPAARGAGERLARGPGHVPRLAREGEDRRRHRRGRQVRDHVPEQGGARRAAAAMGSRTGPHHWAEGATHGGASRDGAIAHAARTRAPTA